jgi:DNA-binding transcriptional ArsR family regulator
MVVKKPAPPRHALGAAQLEAVAQLFAVLSEATRLRILQFLQSAGAASVGEIMDATGIKQANASKQLGILHQAGVLSRQKQGNCVLYSIRLPLVFDLCNLVCTSLREDAHARAKELA